MKKILIGLTVSASTLFYGCGVAPKQAADSNLAAASETADVASSVTTKVYIGAEKGGECGLSISKNAENQVVKMYYFSTECETSSVEGCTISLEKGLFASFSKAPSLQFPGYTRLAFSRGVGPAIIPVIGFMSWDDFIVANDNLSSLKASSSTNLSGKSEKWTSECSDVKLVP